MIMKRKYIPFVFMAWSLLLASCQTIVDNVDLPEIEIKPVVHFRYDGAINTYDCSLTKSNPIFGERRSDFDVIDDAIVSITGLGRTDTVMFIEGIDKYNDESNLDFIDGELYELHITLPDGAQIYAQSEYPVRPQNIDVVVDSFKRDFETVYRIRASWDDIPGIQEYYMLEFYQVYNFDGKKDTISSYVAQVSSGDDAGTRFSQQHEAYAFTEPGSSISVDMFVVLSGITKKEYDYLRFLERYEPENPFTEPTTIPSNVQGALGMFTLKNSRIYKF